ncbi:MAG TPA: UTP--glucose-1-phosphate uridylyltransferase [Roseimicrobium sp.]|nr:UTP--glucose-1-phosphate uridylyltransferase [Roseimicrobium sp.]
MNTGIRDSIVSKMRTAGVSEPAVAAFLGSVDKVIAGDTGFLPEALLEPADGLPQLETMSVSDAPAPELLNRLAVIKLNGGLGTGMGLDRAKSLLPVKDGGTFLDFIARQVFHLRQTCNAPGLSFYLMNSFSTQADTLGYLKKYPGLAPEGELDFLQSMAPKLDAKTLEPVSWPAQPELEWCPPGHGDLYPSLLGCGLLDRLLSRGVKYLFVSNADNLGATVDTRLLQHFAGSGMSFLMEVCERTAADRKGGHLARRKTDGRLLLRESAQCPKDDEASFQDIARHRYFNTNNLWIRLDHLKEELTRRGGALPLALITNHKTVDPRDASSTKVIQLECAMGAAIECFESTGAVVVPRTRFAPVKSTSDLLALRSDAYRVTGDHRLVLDESRNNRPPVIDLDGKHYKLLDGFDACFPDGGAPSLVDCESLTVVGKIVFEPGVVCRGTVQFVNPTAGITNVKAGTYTGSHEITGEGAVS